MMRSKLSTTELQGRITLDGALADLAERGSSWGQMVLGILSMTTLGLVDTRVWQTFLQQQIVEECQESGLLVKIKDFYHNFILVTLAS